MRVTRDGVTSVVPGKVEQEVEWHADAKTPIYAGVGVLVLALLGVGGWTAWNGVKLNTPLGDYKARGLRDSPEFQAWMAKHFLGYTLSKSGVAQRILFKTAQPPTQADYDRCALKGGEVVQSGPAGTWVCAQK